MSNSSTQLSRSSVQRRDQRPELVTTLRSVWQDNPTPPLARAATPQPAPPRKGMRPRRVNSNPVRSQNRPIPKRKTRHTTLHLNPRVRAELERKAQEEGLSVSATGAAIMQWYFQQSITTQHGALLEAIIDKSIRKQMRSYSNRIAVLLVRSLFASEQTRSIVTNILNRQPGVTQPVLETILNGSSNAAKRNITRVTPQLRELLDVVEKWIEEGEQSNG